MGAVFANAPSEGFFHRTAAMPAAATRKRTITIRPTDHIGRPQANMDICAAHTE